MKTKLLALLVSLFVMTACADDKVINGKEYETYGLLNKDEVKDPNIRYHLVTGNVILSVILCETLFMPVYFIGFSIYEPVSAK